MSRNLQDQAKREVLVEFIGSLQSEKLSLLPTAHACVSLRQDNTGCLYQLACKEKETTRGFWDRIGTARVLEQIRSCSSKVYLVRGFLAGQRMQVFMGDMKQILPFEEHLRGSPGFCWEINGGTAYIKELRGDCPQWHLEHVGTIEDWQATADKKQKIQNAKKIVASLSPSERAVVIEQYSGAPE